MPTVDSLDVRVCVCYVGRCYVCVARVTGWLIVDYILRVVVAPVVHVADLVRYVALVGLRWLRFAFQYVLHTTFTLQLIAVTARLPRWTRTFYVYTQLVDLHVLVRGCVGRSYARVTLLILPVHVTFTFVDLIALTLHAVV